MKIVIVGAGGCAREVAWTARESSAEGEPFHVLGYVVSDLSRLGEHDSTSQVLGDLEWLSLNRTKYEGLVMGIGSPLARSAVIHQINSRCPDALWPAVVHPSAQMDRGSVVLERGVVVCANAVVTVNVRVAEHVLIHYGCTVSHEVEIGHSSVLNPASTLSGGVRVGKRVLIGAGARILQYRSIADDAVVGAGAIVTHDVEAHQVVVGSPARPMASTRA